MHPAFKLNSLEKGVIDSIFYCDTFQGVFRKVSAVWTKMFKSINSIFKTFLLLIEIIRFITSRYSFCDNFSVIFCIIKCRFWSAVKDSVLVWLLMEYSYSNLS